VVVEEVEVEEAVVSTQVVMVVDTEATVVAMELDTVQDTGEVMVVMAVDTVRMRDMVADMEEGMEVRDIHHTEAMPLLFEDSTS